MDESTCNCPHCGALYTVTVGQRGAIEKGSAHCKVCQRVMVRWHTPSPPAFRLIERSEGQDSSQPKAEHT
jgi:hypothetical protein